MDGRRQHSYMMVEIRPDGTTAFLIGANSVLQRPQDIRPDKIYKCVRTVMIFQCRLQHHDSLARIKLLLHTEKAESSQA